MILTHCTHHRGLLFFFSSTKSPLMGSKNFLLFKPSPPSSLHSLHDKTHNISSTYRLIPCAFPSKSVPKSLKLSNQPYSSHARIPRPVPDVYLENPIEKRVNSPQLKPVQGNLENIGVNGGSPRPGQTNGTVWTKPLQDNSENIGVNGGSPRPGQTNGMVLTKAREDINSSYKMMNNVTKAKAIREITEFDLQLEPLCKELVTYFAARMISAETLRRNHVQQRRYSNQNVIAFTYRRKGKLVSCKYRDKSKRFWKEADTEKVFYGLDDIEGASEIIIVEGEMDKLSMEEAGFRNCVSVPDGAPPKVSSKELPSEEQDTKYEYLWNCKEYLKEASRIILATDGDQPGQALAEELARRLGRERCLRVRWPKKKKDVHFKDANEVLMIMGPSVLREVVENAEFYPIKGLFNFRDYFSEIDAYYHQTIGYQLGASTGWKALDNLYNVVPGELTIVTGIPNSGKSEWIDALLCNLNGSVGWKFVLCSMENKVREHARKLLEKRMKKPFFDVRYGESVERMSVEDLEAGKEWLNETFHLIRCEDDCLPSVDWVIGLAKAAVHRHGVNGLVIDPYNELDHQRPPNQTETEYVSQMLTKIKRFAQHHGCHVWFVAHPRQLQQWVGNPPNLYDISGSAHFINKCDNGIVIHRNKNPEPGSTDQVQVCVRKVRNKVVGTIGDAFLSYNRVTGEYSDIDQSQAIGG